jgi:hypothetical protein
VTQDDALRVRSRVDEDEIAAVQERHGGGGDGGCDHGHTIVA